jgi:addiction module HigA family antidote
MTMKMNKLPDIHPGEVLEEEFLKPLHISAYRLAKETKIPQTRISEILKAKRRITADTALRLAKFFGTTPQFWLGLQNDYDLEESQKSISEDLIAIHPLAQITTESHA